MTRDRERPRPPDPRLARQPDRRGRRRARVGRARPRGRSLRRVDRRARGGRAARRRRRRTAARASRRRSRTSNGEIAGARARPRRRRPGGRSTRALIELDGTPNKGRLGANAILGVSLAAAKAAAAEAGVLALPLPRRRARRATLPVPMMNVINGGAHAENSIDLQEFMVVPAGAATLRRGAADRRRGLPHAARRCCTSAGSRPRVGDEGGFAPDLGVERGGDRGDPRGGRARRATRDRVAIALDPAATELYARRRLPLRGPRGATAASMVDVLGGARRRATRSSRSRTALAEDDWDDWRRADRAARRPASSSSATTSSSRTPSGCGAGSTRASRNAILVKVNQIGTLTETLDAIELARASRLRGRHLAPLGRDRGHDDRRPRGRDRTPARSRRARPSRTDRVAKYNQLLRIEEELGERAAIRAGTRSRRLPSLARARAIAGRVTAATRRTKIVATIGPASLDARDARAARRRRDGRRPAQLLARHARATHAECARLVRAAAGASSAGRSR